MTVSRAFVSRAKLCLLVVAITYIGLGHVAWASGGATNTVSYSGVITDSTGKPVPYAWIRVRLESERKVVSRMTDAKGKYRFHDVGAGVHTISVERVGYKTGTRLVQTHNGENRSENFMLEEGFSADQLNSEQWVSWIATGHPDASQEAADALQQICSGCHNVLLPARLRGVDKKTWEWRIVHMDKNNMMPLLDDALLDKMTTILEKYFGPDSVMPTAADIPLPIPAPEALKATYVEYDIPLPKIRAHSAIVDKDDQVWVTGYDWNTNSIGKFDISSESFQWWELPTPRSSPHTFSFDDSGQIWVPESWSDQLGVINPVTGELKEYKVPSHNGAYVYPHSTVITSDGNIWISCMISAQLAEFNPTTEEFNIYPVPDDHNPSGSGYTLDIIKGWATDEPPAKASESAMVYGISADSRDKIWFTEYNGGRVVMFDPDTKKFTSYDSGVKGFTPRGLIVASDDRTWFANFTQKRIGVINPATGKLKQYKVPSLAGTPYALTEGPKGEIWYSDFDANLIGKFHPKTEKFVEYPLPMLESTPRFFGFDSNGNLWYSGFMTRRLGQIIFDSK